MSEPSPRPFVFLPTSYGCETWSLLLREECYFTGLQSSGMWCFTHLLEIHNTSEEPITSNLRVNSSKKLATMYETVWYHNREHHNPNFYCHGKHKSHTTVLLLVLFSTLHIFIICLLDSNYAIESVGYINLKEVCDFTYCSYSTYHTATYTEMKSFIHNSLWKC